MSILKRLVVSQIVMLLCLVPPNTTAQADDTDSIILVRLTMEVPPEVGTTRPRVVLGKYDSDFSESVYLGNGLQQIRVQPGNYYIKRMVTGYLNTVNPDIAQPKSLDQTLEVQAGTVTYIGDFHIDKAFAIQIKHLPVSLQEALADTSIPRKPLRLAAFGRKPMTLTWE